MRTTWVVQSNLQSSDTFGLLRKACSDLDFGFIGIEVRQRQVDLSILDQEAGRIVFHGATSLIQRAAEHEVYRDGVFYDAHTFTHEAYVRGFGSAYVNHSAQLLKWDEVLSLPFTAKTRYFLKPRNDLKSFTGSVCTREQLARIRSELIKHEHLLQDLVVVNEPCEIDAEWRLFVVGDKIVSGSMYRPSMDPNVPSDALAFASEAIVQWTPHEVFVLDIGRVDRQWRVIECNCFNWCRFYSSNVLDIVQKVSEFQLSRRTTS